MRAYLATPDLGLRLVNLPGYSPDFNADEVIWDWAREEVTANLCLGTKAAVQEKLGHFFCPVGLPNRRGQATVSNRLASTGGGPPQANPG